MVWNRGAYTSKARVRAVSAKWMVFLRIPMCQPLRMADSEVLGTGFIRDFCRKCWGIQAWLHK